VLSNIAEAPKMERLNQICVERDAMKVSAALRGLVDELLKDGSVGPLKEWIQKVVSDDVPQQASIPALQHLSSSLSQLRRSIEQGTLPGTFPEVANFALRAIQQHPTAGHDESDFILRHDVLFEHYVSEQDFKSAAEILSKLSMENTTKKYSIDTKADVYIKVAEAFLLDDSADQAEIFVTKASVLMNDVTSLMIQMRYKTKHAQVLDANRKFVEAAMRFFELSITPSEKVELLQIQEQNLLDLLGMAVTCAVLGKAGPQRSRVLGVLYKDDRLSQLALMPKYASHASILTKMYTEQLVHRDEMAVFEQSLQPHQKALTADGYTFPEKAVIEHNMLAAGRLYDNIHFRELGSLLRLDAAKAETVAAKMIVEDRLKATIDQTDGTLIFLSDDDALLSWDARIRDVCTELVETVQIVQSKG